MLIGSTENSQIPLQNSKTELENSSLIYCSFIFLTSLFVVWILFLLLLLFIGFVVEQCILKTKVTQTHIDVSADTLQKQEVNLQKSNNNNSAATVEESPLAQQYSNDLKRWEQLSLTRRQTLLYNDLPQFLADVPGIPQTPQQQRQASNKCSVETIQKNSSNNPVSDKESLVSHRRSMEEWILPLRLRHKILHKKPNQAEPIQAEPIQAEPMHAEPHVFRSPSHLLDVIYHRLNTSYKYQVRSRSLHQGDRPCVGLIAHVRPDRIGTSRRQLYSLERHSNRNSPDNNGNKHIRKINQIITHLNTVDVETSRSRNSSQSSARKKKQLSFNKKGTQKSLNLNHIQTKSEETIGTCMGSQSSVQIRHYRTYVKFSQSERPELKNHSVQVSDSTTNHVGYITLDEDISTKHQLIVDYSKIEDNVNGDVLLKELEVEKHYNFEKSIDTISNKLKILTSPVIEDQYNNDENGDGEQKSCSVGTKRTKKSKFWRKHSPCPILEEREILDTANIILQKHLKSRPKIVRMKPVIVSFDKVGQVGVVVLFQLDGNKLDLWDFMKSSENGKFANLAKYASCSSKIFPSKSNSRTILIQEVEYPTDDPIIDLCNNLSTFLSREDVLTKNKPFSKPSQDDESVNLMTKVSQKLQKKALSPPRCKIQISLSKDPGVLKKPLDPLMTEFQRKIRIRLGRLKPQRKFNSPITSIITRKPSKTALHTHKFQSSQVFPVSTTRQESKEKSWFQYLFSRRNRLAEDRSTNS